MSRNEPFQGINPDDYLDKLKPKPIVYKTKQQIFDHCFRTIVKQKVPVVRRDDATGKFHKAHYNQAAFVSPLYSHMTPLDIRVLQKTLGYEKFRDISIADIEDYIGGVNAMEGTTLRHVHDQLGPGRIEVCKKVVDVLELRGLDKLGTAFLCLLARHEQNWFQDLLDMKVKFESLTSTDFNKLAVLTPMTNRMFKFAGSFGLSDEVLKLTP